MTDIAFVYPTPFILFILLLVLLQDLAQYCSDKCI
jgi:hypothetical protein